jgi:rare lipoprotein A
LRASGGTNKPYTVLGRSYVPITDDRPLREAGLASWYGSKFHGQPTASGEPYNMYAMTAAHKTLPLPSYVRVRNPGNGREVIVRVNDRGPFHDDRVIDLSYTAALRLDLLRGVAPVEIERITNEDIRTGAWRRGGPEGTALAQNSPVAPTAIAGSALATQTREPAAQPNDSVQVPMVMTSPVVSTLRAEVTELPPMVQPVSEAAAPPDAAAPPRVSAAASNGFWVQLGAFSQRDGADRFQQQVARNMPTLAASLNVFSERGTYRLQSGPYASRELARDTAEQVRNGMQLVPMIVERR